MTIQKSDRVAAQEVQSYYCQVSGGGFCGITVVLGEDVKTRKRHSLNEICTALLRSMTSTVRYCLPLQDNDLKAC
jgi:hypothetical protein